MFIWYSGWGMTSGTNLLQLKASSCELPIIYWQPMLTEHLQMEFKGMTIKNMNRFCSQSAICQHATP